MKEFKSPLFPVICEVELVFIPQEILILFYGNSDPNMKIIIWQIHDDNTVTIRKE